MVATFYDRTLAKAFGKNTSKQKQNTNMSHPSAGLPRWAARPKAVSLPHSKVGDPLANRPGRGERPDFNIGGGNPSRRNPPGARSCSPSEEAAQAHLRGNLRGDGGKYEKITQERAKAALSVPQQHYTRTGLATRRQRSGRNE